MSDARETVRDPGWYTYAHRLVTGEWREDADER